MFGSELEGTVEDALLNSKLDMRPSVLIITGPALIVSLPP